jgi:IclR family acetate operon transcriptional repressor
VECYLGVRPVVNQMSEQVQSVVRAFQVLRVLSAHDDPVPLATLARETGLPKSTISRLLVTLSTLGIVERGYGEGTYTTGPALPALATGARSTAELLGVAHAYLVDLVERHGEDAALAVPDGDGVIYTDQAQTSQPIQVPDWSRQRFVPHTVAAGFVMMAWWPTDRLEAYLAEPLGRTSPKTMTEPEAIRRRLQGIRRRGYAWAADEWVDGITAVSAPVVDRRGELVAAVSMFGPSYRFPGGRDPDAVALDVAASARLLARHLK